jgi:hypothetical protein
MRLQGPRLCAIAALACFAFAGCTDDITCPEPPQEESAPYIYAFVDQRTGGRTEWTHAEVSCTADPLPSLLIAFINGREISELESQGELGLRVTLDDDIVIWQPGTLCSLGVTTNYGYATATGVMPEGPDVIAPETISLGDTLALSWGRVSDADYYRVDATLFHVGAAPGTASPEPAYGSRDSLSLSAVTRDTSVFFLPDEIGYEGSVVGVVEAISGPYPESGAEGNVSGDGWGFFTLRHSGPGSDFSVNVALGSAAGTAGAEPRR